jgi:hypothetical protein
MRSVSIQLLALFCVGCTSETPEVNYDTHAVAEDAGALRRGWLPPWLPRESTRIFERHNIYTNARMWISTVPLGIQVTLPAACASIKATETAKKPFTTRWWPEAEPHHPLRPGDFYYFKCGNEFVGLARGGGELLGWAPQ